VRVAPLLTVAVDILDSYTMQTGSFSGSSSSINSTNYSSVRGLDNNALRFVESVLTVLNGRVVPLRSSLAVLTVPRHIIHSVAGIRVFIHNGDGGSRGTSLF
jgi:hypothetical protein